MQGKTPNLSFDNPGGQAPLAKSPSSKAASPSSKNVLSPDSNSGQGSASNVLAGVNSKSGVQAGKTGLAGNKAGAQRNVVDVANMSPRTECNFFSKKLIEDMQAPAMATPPPEDYLVLQSGILKIQGYQVECQLLQYDCGPVETAQAAEEPAEEHEKQRVHVYLHVLRMDLGAPLVNGLAPYRPILVRQREDAGREDLNAENWTLSKVGGSAGVNLRFRGGGLAASQDGSVREPVQSAIDANAESTAAAHIWVEIFQQVQALRAEYEKAALEYSESTAMERKRAREEEQRKKEIYEEETRPDKLWKAVKSANAKQVFDLLKRPYKHTKPQIPLMELKDESEWSLLHWAAHNEKGKETCQVLIKQNADPFAQDAAGNTPLHVACFSNCKETTTPLIEAMQVARGSSAPSVANKFGSTAMMEAASNGHSELAAALMKLKIDWIPVPLSALGMNKPTGAAQKASASKR